MVRRSAQCHPSIVRYRSNDNDNYICARFRTAETFVTRFITIRNKRASEILAELGGLWAAATAFIAIIWSNSGHLNKKGGSEMMIFKYLPGSKRKAYLSGYSIIPKDETAKDIEGQQH